MATSKFKLAAFESEWSENKRKDLIFLARTAEAAERYDDMCKCMHSLVTLVSSGRESGEEPLSVDERNLLSVAYKNVIGARRASWRTLNAESQDESKDHLVNKYKKQVEIELNKICKEVIKLLEDELIIKADINKWLHRDEKHNALDGECDVKFSSPETKVPGEAQIFYLKMAGDYYRYLAEAVKSEESELATHDYYRDAFDLSQKVLEPTHPIRLGLALNYSVCFYEILKQKKKACQLAKDAFDEAISKLDKLEEADYKDSTLIMQLLRDNLTLWTSTDGDDDEDGERVEDNQDGD